jgi:hypothetical protein
VNHFYQNVARAFAAAALATSALLIWPGSTTLASTTTKTVSTTDKTASISLPSGWVLAKGANGFMQITGPNSSDEQINLGVIIVAKDAPTGTPTQGEVLVALPWNSSLKDKFTTIYQTAASKRGLPDPQITFANEAPTKFQACSRFWGSMHPGQKSLKFEGVMCSLKRDYLGLYKNVFYIAQVPSNLVTKDRSIVEQIVQAYRVTPDMFKKMIAPYTMPPPMPAGGAMSGSSALYRQASSLQSANCFDYNIIRESPPWEMPSSCGGWQPG